MQQALTPDLNEARRFLEALDPSATFWTFQTFDDNHVRKDEKLAKVLHGTLEEHAATLTQYQGRGAGVFVTVNKTDGRGRTKENITGVRAFFLDLDGAPLEPVRAWEEPHIICATSSGRWHTYWLVNNCPLEAFGTVQKDLIACFGADNVYDLPRVMRLPGFWHQKAEPSMVRLVHSNAFPVAFSFDEFEAKLNAKHPPRNSERANPRGGFHDHQRESAAGRPCSDEVAEILTCIPPDCGYADWLSVLMGLHEWSGGSQEGFSIADEWSAKGVKYKLGEVQAKWKGFTTNGGTNWATVAALARENGADLRAIARKYKGSSHSGSSWGSAKASGQEPRSDNRWSNAPDNPDLSQDAMAVDLGQRCWDQDARHVAAWGKWLFWNGIRWEVDAKLDHLTRVRAYVRNRAQEILDWAERKAAALDAQNPGDGDRLRRWAKEQARNLRSKNTVTAVESLARSNAASVARPTDFDDDRLLLGTPGGTVDLRTGELRRAERDDMVTKLTACAPADPGVSPNLWLRFLAEIFDGDADIVAFMQRVAGYALTGLTTENKLLFLYGTGRNGKSVFINTLTWLWADYARRAASETFLHTHGEKHSTGLAGLQGARLVAGSELPVGKTWDESVIKDLTGGDKMTARFMRGDFFDFDPQLTLMIAGNNQPSFRGVDEAIRARVLLVPFTVTIPPEKRDKDLPEKLKAEGPAILRWAIDGALQWQKHGLGVPAKVVAASTDYMDEEDTLGQFIRDELLELLGHFTSSEDLHQRFGQWCHRQGLNVWSQLTLVKELKNRGFEAAKSNGRRGLKGLKMR